MLAELAATPLTYGPIPGSPRLRALVAGLYAAQGPDNVLITHGAIGANALVHTALVEPGDHIVAVVPTYQQHYSLPDSYGARVDRLALREEDGWLPDLAALDRLVTPDTRLIALNNPNNPTGALIDEAGLTRITEIARRAGAWVLCDEVYRGVDQHGDGFTASIADLYERGISTGSMSKPFSLAGLRLGWIVAPTGLLADVATHRDYTTISVGRVDDLLACVALENKAAILARSHRITRTNLTVLDTWVALPRRHPLRPARLGHHRPAALRLPHRLLRVLHPPAGADRRSVHPRRGVRHRAHRAHRIRRRHRDPAHRPPSGGRVPGPRRPAVSRQPHRLSSRHATHGPHPGQRHMDGSVPGGDGTPLGPACVCSAPGGGCCSPSRRAPYCSPPSTSTTTAWTSGAPTTTARSCHRCVPRPGGRWLDRPDRWAYRFADHLLDAPDSPLHDGRWLLSPDSPLLHRNHGRRPHAEHWASMLVEGHPDGYIDWFVHHGSWEVLPLRPLPEADDSRVRAYRRQARDGTLPPVLLWWVSGLDCHLILDGHARLAAAIAESTAPSVLHLHRTAPSDEVAAGTERAVHHYEAELARFAELRAVHGSAVPDGAALAGPELARRLGELHTGQRPSWAWPLDGGETRWRCLADEAASRRWPDGASPA
ncbi:aminotransferase class I/II-fold pyridoxal phosphate-dependent enzyme [Streptomyces lasalocidi]